jgi:probable F420-dependent oxidoreductase
MKIGILAWITSKSPDSATVAKKCEALGFESLFLPEHPIIPVHCKTPYPIGDGKIPELYSRMIDPFIGLAFAAAATSRIKLGTGICLLPEHEPIALAKEIATLDLYSGGRFIFGIGAGWLVDESEIMGVDFRRRWAMTREYVGAMKELWTKPEASFDGEFIKFPPVLSYPKPAQKPHPPVHIGAGGLGPVERALKNTVAVGDGWAPLGMTPDRLATELAKLKKMCAEADRDFSRIEISMYFPVVEGDPRRVIAQYREAGCHRLVFAPPTLESNAEAELEQLAKLYVQ